ncbi:MAG: hypothetical protein AAGC69_22815 [Paracraurococcus sp.]
MHTSRPIEVRGRFLGVAVTHLTEPPGQGWRFVAINPLVKTLDGATFASLGEAQRVAGLALARNHDRPSDGIGT